MSNLLKKKTVLKVKEFLERNFPEIELIQLEETARSAQDAAKSLKKEVGAIVKSLLFKNIKTNDYYLCLVSGDQYMSLDKLSKIIGNKIIKCYSKYSMRMSSSSINHIKFIEIFINKYACRCMSMSNRWNSPN